MINRIIHSLNQLEVKGKNNLDILLGCIMALEEIQKQMEAPKNAQPPAEEEVVDG